MMQHWGAKPGQRTAWWWRLVGYLLTNFLAYAPLVSIDSALPTHIGGWDSLNVSILVWGGVYFAVAIRCWRRSTTPAKAILGMVICNADTKQLAGFRRVAARQLTFSAVNVLVNGGAYYLMQPAFLRVDVLFQLYGYAVAGGTSAGILIPILDAAPVFTRSRQRILDKVFHTVVVDR